MSSFNMGKYWKAVRETRGSLQEEFPFVTSIADEVSGAKGGMVCQVDRENAAILLVKKTHRLATPDEVAQYRADEDALREIYRHAELQRRTLAVLQPENPGPARPKAKAEK